VKKDEPLRLELASFLECVASRRAPEVDGRQALAALEVSLGILAKIEEHAQVVARSVSKL